MPSPLQVADPASLGLAPRPLEHLDRLIKQHIEEGRYPCAQIAIARHGKLALFRGYGRASTEPARETTDDTLFLLFSNTKVITATPRRVTASIALATAGSSGATTTTQSTCRPDNASRRATSAIGSSA